nr:SapB/AmfS family lanthipeptide [Kitasatospora mediocidica]
MEILELQGLELPQDENHDNASTLSVLNCGNSTVSTLICL